MLEATPRKTERGCKDIPEASLETGHLIRRPGCTLQFEGIPLQGTAPDRQRKVTDESSETVKQSGSSCDRADTRMDAKIMSWTTLCRSPAAVQTPRAICSGRPRRKPRQRIKSNGRAASRSRQNHHSLERPAAMRATVEKSVRCARRNGNCGFQQSSRSSFLIPPPLLSEALILPMCT